MTNRTEPKVKLTKYIVTSSLYSGMTFGTCFESDKDLSKIVNVSRYNTALHLDIAINPPPAPGRPSKDEPEAEEEVPKEVPYEDFKEKVLEPEPKATTTKSTKKK